MRFVDRPLRQLLVFDFAFALSAGCGYFLISLFYFDFLVGRLQLPKAVVYSQIAANFSYGIAGVTIYLFAKRLDRWFYRLAIMNWLYAIACLAAASILLYDSRYWGGAVLAAEAMIIALLAEIERRAIIEQARHNSSFPLTSVHRKQS